MRFLRRGTEPFSPEHHYRQTSEGAFAQRAEHVAAAEFWILARSQYRVKTLPLRHVAANRRDAAIKLEMAAWTPFGRTGHYVLPQADGALLMAWDVGQVELSMAALGVTERELRVLPESAWRAAPATGIALLQCLEGVEGMAAVGGNVQSSLWWRELPSETEWLNFLRTSGLDSAQRGPRPAAAQASGWLSQPQGYTEGQRELLLAGRELWPLAAVAFLLAVATLWFANDWRRYAQAQADSEQRLRATEQDLNSLLGARGVALASLLRTDQLGALFNRADALNLLATISRQLSTLAKPGTLQLVEFEWRDRHLVLVLTANGPPPAATAIVKALESVPAFHDVQVNPEGNRTRVELRVDGGGSAAPAAPAAAVKS